MLPQSLSRIYARLGITPEHLAEFCQHHQIAELALFGSILRDDFNPDSDIDFLVSYLPTAQRNLLQKLCLQEQLETLLGRPVDLVSKTAIERSRNWLRRQNILSSAKVIYVARY
ncbi:nucleotidyltransferase domain-containing protein [Spirulina subsalsa FACHB-351]|uniref:Nucleotidyltransferase domain-containing protein n=1 Tax=Spirulina subsalsa FACHB-351 TaxID=234711 RepID=A0ABT3L784_9CYAN|nr:nucleotidyltransferase domain-containing protein [Spirulina subsalsa]MCW6037371.1 nucleotidyltransferase domain-containing protein [Spirulina subsalsa FACHB-351]